MTTRPPGRSRPKASSAIPPTLHTVVPDVPPRDMPLPESMDDAGGLRTQFTGERTEYRDRQGRIERLAYLIAESRGFEPGHELEDWLAAEKRVDAEEPTDPG